MRVCRISYGPANRYNEKPILLSRATVKHVPSGQLEFYFLNEAVAREIAKKLTLAHKSEGIKYYVMLTSVESVDRLPKEKIINTLEEFIQKMKERYNKTIQALERT